MNTWAVALVSLAISFLIVFPALGLYLYSPRRARLVRHAEAVDERQAVVAHISYIRLKHPDIVKVERLDRHPAYVLMNVGLMYYGWVTSFVIPSYANMSSADMGTRLTLAFSLLFGASITLIGSLLGGRIFGHVIGPKISDNDVSAMLGDDIRVPYALGWLGMSSTFISMAFYGYTTVRAVDAERLLTTYGGIQSIVICIICLIMVRQFVKRIQIYLRARNTILTEAYAIMAEEDG